MVHQDRRILIAISLVVIIAGAFFASPYIVVRKAGRIAAKGDATALARCQWPLENPHFWPRKIPTVPIPTPRANARHTVSCLLAVFGLLWRSQPMAHSIAVPLE